MTRRADAMPASARLPALVSIEGPSAGRIYRITTDVVVGRADGCAVQVRDDGVSRRHCEIKLVEGQIVVADLGSKNGTAVNGERIAAPRVLVDGDTLRLGPATLLRFALRDHVEEEAQRRLYDLATRDPLTQAYNRRGFDECFAAEWAWATRHRNPLAFCAIDVDFFKRINDRFGHGAGDRVLVEIAGIVRRTIRIEDVFARIGGEEFVVLARATAHQAAMALAERVREAVAGGVFERDGEAFRSSVSIGVATSTDPGVDEREVLQARADAALYVAKNEGRNRVVSSMRTSGTTPSSDP